MPQPSYILNSRGQSSDSLIATDGTVLLKLGIGQKSLGSLTPLGAYQGVATHVNGDAFDPAEDGIVVGGGVTSGDVPTRFLVDTEGRVITSSGPSGGVLTDRSSTITAGGTSQSLCSALVTRRYLFIQNIDPTEDMWVNFTSAAAVDTAGSILIPAGGSVVYEGSFVPTEAVKVIAATTGHKYTAKEG